MLTWIFQENRTRSFVSVGAIELLQIRPHFVYWACVMTPLRTLTPLLCISPLLGWESNVTMTSKLYRMELGIYDNFFRCMIATYTRYKLLPGTLFPFCQCGRFFCSKGRETIGYSTCGVNCGHVRNRVRMFRRKGS